MTTPLRRDYKMEQRVGEEGLKKIWGGKSVRERGKTLGNTRGNTEEPRQVLGLSRRIKSDPTYK